MGIISKFKSYSGKKKAIIVTGAAVGIILGFVAWWLISPLFLPGTMLNENLTRFDDAIPQSGTNTTVTDGEEMTEPVISEFTLLFTGSFVEIDNAHKGTGSIRIVNSTDGELFLIFDDVEISNGPALKVYLSKKSSFSGTGDSAGAFRNLGDLKANIGSFSMAIPSGIDLSSYKSILIWCEPFEVVFTWATLIPA